MDDVEPAVRSCSRERVLQELVLGLRKTSGQSVLFSHSIAERLGINPTALECLDILGQHGPMAAGRLADLTGLTTGAITGLVDRLEQSGFVRREVDPEDRRRVIVHRVPDRDADIGRLYASMYQATVDLASRYTDAELQLVVDFLGNCYRIGQAETAKLRAIAAPGASGAEILAPLNGASEGRLIFANGAANVTLEGDPFVEGLLHAHFDGPVPVSDIETGTVTIRYRGFNPFDWRRTAAQVRLNTSIPWELSIEGGVSDLRSCLDGLQIRSIVVAGGANKAELILPQPAGRVPVTFKGGASKITISRPAGVSVRVNVLGGVSRMQLDDQRFGSIGGQARLESAAYSESSDRYEIEISGGASRILVAERTPARGC